MLIILLFIVYVTIIYVNKSKFDVAYISKLHFHINRSELIWPISAKKKEVLK